ncbi:MAG: hypothetical protein ACLGSD_05340 [Acidobacteriota bacterium]
MKATPVRGTQSLVRQMGWVFRRPSLTGIEVAWRWVFGVPLLFICWVQAQKILAALSLDATGLDTLDITNPWLSAVKVGAAWQMYEPHVARVMMWLGPVAALAWIVLSGIGRNLVLKQMEPRISLRPVSMIVLQAAWLGVLVFTVWGWWSLLNWAAARDIGNGADPDLVGYFGWVIFLTIGFFALWAVVSWAVAIAPMLVLLERRSVASALRESTRLGKSFTGKLIEINLVMGIVTMALCVLVLVFSAALVPFADQIGTSPLEVEWLAVSVFYFIASDYFQVVRLKQFVEFWRVYRGPQTAA